MAALLQDVPRNGRPFAASPNTPLLPSPKRCRNCGDPMRLWRNGPNNPRVWGCGTCHAENERRRRARVRASRAGKLLGQVLDGRLRVETTLRHLEELLRLTGGWSGLRDSLSPADRAKLSIKLAEVVDQEAARVEEAQPGLFMKWGIFEPPSGSKK